MTRAMFLSMLAVSASTCASVFAGDFIDAGIPAADPRIVGWATGVSSLVRGPQNIANPGGPLASFGDATSPLGPPGLALDTVSLGDGGSITVTFDSPIRDGIGADFAVFENTFEAGAVGSFAELGFVDVSSDGTNFFRFDSISLTPVVTQVETFGTLDPTNIFNLAGKHTLGTGTGFDLLDLATASPLLDVNTVRFVRITDVVGSINPQFARLDSLGNIINDPFTTTFATGGFDLNAVGVINTVVPEPAGLSLLALIALAARRRRHTGTSTMRIASLTALALTAAASSASANALINFEDITLPASGFDNGGPTANSDGFVSNGALLSNDYSADWGGYWSGYSISNVSNVLTPGFTNQYAAYTGSGVGGSGNYAVGYYSALINLPAGERPVEVKLTNTTYAALSMRDGDGFAKKFGGASGNDPDLFSITLTGYASPGGTGTPTGSATLALADYTFANNTQDYILNQWTTLDLTSLGNARSIGLSWSSTDSSPVGPNTPTYVALDNLVTVPEPAAVLLLAAAMIGRRRR